MFLPVTAENNTHTNTPQVTACLKQSVMGKEVQIFHSNLGPVIGRGWINRAVLGINTEIPQQGAYFPNIAHFPVLVKIQTELSQ